MLRRQFTKILITAGSTDPALDPSFHSFVLLLYYFRNGLQYFQERCPIINIQLQSFLVSSSAAVCLPILRVMAVQGPPRYDSLIAFRCVVSR
jgi:hypothetical protein